MRNDSGRSEIRLREKMVRIGTRDHLLLTLLHPTSHHITHTHTHTDSQGKEGALEERGVFS